ncbi:hypothetical protein PENTCL1PPCAC_17213 [Pristionchus entomophagus]|uniref:non-specific serine/threonine protein kinase n=1 Tax=Pristionchus entomophagus TaxID=358040 RepID=A0AAV5TKV6_9BILA|nr:hypothetical protein PENTCL1PPCAC_17213 [Pristionchus entomophagus]
MGDSSKSSFHSVGSAQSASNCSYDVLSGQYALHDEIGAGGFGKVRLATHLLTGQRCAIKIIDKKAIGDDLPRVKTELDALRTLQHQNICRLYQEIETEEKFFLIMEYCSGGEMFDYIVRKARLEESEARHFFRQLVQAMAYIHDKGFAHRDLKPENLLLTEDLHLKVIDFGLCAKPNGLFKPLETCCGSPAYAAPELIKGTPYLGNEADVWSMGVLLYALLCGTLPFEDDNMQGLYRKILAGKYPVPDHLSPCSKQLLSRMLQVTPSHRITVQQLLEHQWLNKNYQIKIKWNSIYDKSFVDLEVAKEMSWSWNRPLDEMTGLIKEWKFDYLTATYFILLNQKMKGRQFVLPGPRASKNDLCNVVNSPTIHASLDNNLDRSGLEDDLDGLNLLDDDVLEGDEERERDVRFAHPASPDRKANVSYAQAILHMPSVMTGRSPQQRIPGANGAKGISLLSGLPVMGTPAASSKRNPRVMDSVMDSGKENRRGTASCRVRGPVRVGPDEDRPKSIYATPQRNTLKGLFSPLSAGRQRASSAERGERNNALSVASSPISGNWRDDDSSCERTPRSTAKTPRLKQRMFASLERKTEKVISMLTPRKLRQNRSDLPEVVTEEKGMINLSVTSSTEPEKVKDQLIRVFEKHNMKYEVNGWKISGRQKDSMGHQMTVRLEIVYVEALGKVGVRRKRLNGDAFLYKRVCESVLLMADI